MLDPDEPEIIQNGAGICCDLCTDGGALVKGVRSAGAAMGLDNELNGALAFDVDNAVGILAEDERAMDVSADTAALRIGGSNIGGPYHGTFREAYALCKGYGSGGGIVGIACCKGVFIRTYHDGVPGSGEIFDLLLSGRICKHEGLGVGS